MNSQTLKSQTLKSISWRDTCPWLMLVQSIAIAVRGTVWGIAFIGLLLTPLVWNLSESIFLSDSEIIGSSLNPNEVNVQNDAGNEVVRKKIQRMSFWSDSADENWLANVTPLPVFFKFGSPHLALLDPALSIQQNCYYFFGLIGMLILWSLCGGMICRVAATHFTRDERTGPIQAFLFCSKRYVTFLLSGSVPLMVILVFTIPLFFIGILIRIDFMLLLVGFGWCLLLFIGFLMTLLLVPLFFGWSFLWPAIATENADPFEAVSRSFSYPYQKPFQFLFYLTVVLILGFLSSFIVTEIANKSISITQWGTSWGAGFDRVDEIAEIQRLPLDSNPTTTENDPVVATPSDQEIAPTKASYSKIQIFSVKMISFWEGAIRLLAQAFNYGFFFAASTGMYLLMRRDTDQTELDEIYLEALPTDEALPKLQSESLDSAPPAPSSSPASPGSTSESAANSESNSPKIDPPDSES